MTARLALAALLLVAPFATAAKNCDPHTFGAKADGVTLDTAALQKAIDTCSAASGSAIELSAGTWLTAPLTLRSHTHLILDKDAVLLASTNTDDFPRRTEPGNTWRRTALIHADDVTDISITGTGVIDGNGAIWWAIKKQQKKNGDDGKGFGRPLLIDIVHSSQILFDGVTLRNSPSYNLTLFLSHDITIQNILIRNPSDSPNTDGIDPFFSSNIKIDHVSIDTGDDCIAIKSGLVERGEPNIASSDITITNSEMLHGHGLAIGSEVAGGVHNVTVDNVTFKGTKAGIRVKSNRTRGNDVYNLHYSNITMEGVILPISISEYYPKPIGGDTAQPMAEHTPRFHDITIKNMKATGAQTAMQIMGLPESPIKSLSLENVSISAKKGATISNVEMTEKNVTIDATTPPAMTQGEGVRIEQLK